MKTVPDISRVLSAFLAEAELGNAAMFWIIPAAAEDTKKSPPSSGASTGLTSVCEEQDESEEMTKIIVVLFQGFLFNY